MLPQPALTPAAKWIWVPEFDDTINPGQFVLFRRTFHLAEKPTHQCILHVSADTRYRLFINGHSVSFGPCKSYPTRWYYETVEISEFLDPGENVLSAQVLRFSSSHACSSSLARTPLPGLLVFCEIENQTLHTDEAWKAKKDASRQLLSTSEWDFRLGPPFLDLNEKVDGNKSELGWKEIGFDDTNWSFAEIRSMARKMSPALDPRRLTPRSIPVLPEVQQTFDGVVTCQGKTTAEQWEELLKKGVPIDCAENSTTIVDIESDVLTTGFLQLDCASSGNVEIVITCAECYENDMDNGQPRTKGNRRDYVNGKLYGTSDTYITHPDSNDYEPFWWRTFRYIRLHITCTTSSLRINSFTYRSTHYPLPITTTLSTRSPELTALWKISLNTLKNCMHETYEDCNGALFILAY